MRRATFSTGRSDSASQRRAASSLARSTNLCGDMPISRVKTRLKLRSLMQNCSARRATLGLRSMLAMIHSAAAVTLGEAATWA